MIYALKKIIFTSCFFLIFTSVYAQTDNTFWFAIPWETPEHMDQTAAVRVSMEDYADTILITAPANPLFDTVTMAIGANETQTADLTPYIDDLATKAHSTISNESLLIQSKNGNDFTCYFEYTTTNNPDIFALKGDNALGKDFWVPFQRHWWNQDYSTSNPAYSAINIVATENNTEVTITPSQPTADGHVAGDTYTITLDKGETYKVVPAFNGGKPSRDPSDRLAGTHVTANKKISITTSDDSCVKNGAWDMIGDQLIPTDLVGTDYILMKGEVKDDNEGERVYFTATEDGTDIFIDGTQINATSLNQGEQISYRIPPGKNALDIKTSKPAYVFHVAGFTAELGGAVLPRTDGCTGSLDVSFVRSRPNPDQFFVNLMVKKNGLDSMFMENSAGVTKISPTWFEQVDTTNWYVLKDSTDVNDFFENNVYTGEVTRFYNKADVFHLGIINGVSSGGGCRYGYFSDFKELEAEAISVKSGTGLLIGCDQDSVQLEASGGIAYKWSPTEYLSDPNSSSPVAFPPKGDPVTFDVKITQPCYGPTNEQVVVYIPTTPHAFFTIDKTQGCAPLTVHLNNESEDADDYIWDFGDGDFSTKDDNITHTYSNTSDTAREYVITLSASNNAGCSDKYRDTVTVYPEITADFEIADPNDTIGCAPVSPHFYSTSTGNTDTYYWDFDDGSSSNDSAVTHQFTNYGTDDTTYNVRLIASSPYHCRDTSDTMQIHVHPYIHVEFALDSATSCATYEAKIHNNSEAVDSFYLDYGDGTDTSFTSSFGTIRHLYTNTDTVPHTYMITLIGYNEEGCIDSMKQKVRVSPSVNAAFNANPTHGCDSVPIQFTNNSSGYELDYSWKFGDGSSSKSKDPLHLYTNKSTTERIDTVMLAVESKYFCRDTMYDTVHIYPYINADFAIDTAQGCPPFKAGIDNQSRGVDTYNWNFDDGTTSSTSDTSFVHTFSNTSYTTDSVYNITLSVKNIYGCTDTLSRNVTVYPDVLSEFTVDPYESCFPAEFDFTSQSKGASYYMWNYGDGATSVSTDSTSHQYPKNLTDTTKDYHVSLLVTGVHNHCTDLSDTVIQVKPYTKAQFSIEDDIGCGPFETTFDNSSVGRVDTFRWYVNDTLKTTLYDTSDVSHTFSNPNTVSEKYPIRLEASNIQGCSDVFYDTVAVYSTIEADFGVNPGYSGCAPFDVQFIDSTVGAGHYYWDFGDNSSSVKAAPSHRFSNHSSVNDTSYTVKLNISAKNCSDSVEKEVNVYARPNASFNPDTITGCPPLTVTIDNNSSSANPVYNWDFDDGSTLTTTADSTVHHVYDNSSYVRDSIFDLKLSVENDHGCKDSLTQKLTVFSDINADFTPDPIESCSPPAFEFYNQSQGASHYEWDFDDGATSAVSDTAFHEYENNNTDTAKKYRVQLTATASNKVCQDVKDTVITVNPYLDAEFSIEDYIGCGPFETTFDNSSVGRVDTFRWYVNDTLKTTLYDTSDVSHTFSNPNTVSEKYPIRLEASNIQGCSDVFYDTVAVYSTIEADFGIKQGYSGCHPFHAQFVDSSTAAQNYYWDFGDNNSSVKASPKHTFHNFDHVNDTTYTVSLSIKAKNCGDTIEKNVQVFARPNASFNPDTITGCPPFTVTIDNNSSSANPAYKWDFDDGSTLQTTADSTIHHVYDNSSYVRDSIFDLKLSVENDHGCKDSLVQKITAYSDIQSDFTPNVMESCNPPEFKFNNRSKGAAHYLWNFDDGATSGVADTAIHEYQQNNTDTTKKYQVSLFVTANNKNCTDVKDTVVEVHPYLDASFSVENYIDCPPFKNTLGNGAIGKVDTSYWYVNGNLDTTHMGTKDFTRIYANTDTSIRKYPVRLEVVNKQGCIDDDYDTVKVYPDVEAGYNVSPGYAGCHPFEVDFTDTSKSGKHYKWNFGDGATSVQKDPDHEFTNYSNTEDTTYTVGLEVRSHNCIDSVKKDLTVYASPSAVFYVDQSAGCHPDTVQFTNNSEVTSANYYWDYNDNSTPDTTNDLSEVSHVFYNDSNQILSYKVQMTAQTTTGCKDRVSSVIQVYPNVVADFVYDTSGCAPLNIQFTNQSRNEDFYNWDFGDGLEATEEHPRHYYDNPTSEDTVYNVDLIVRSTHGCIDSTEQNIDIYPTPNPKFNVSPDFQVFDDTTEIKVTNLTQYRNAWDYTWDFDDGNTATHKDSIFIYQYQDWPDARDNYVYDISVNAINPEHPECNAMAREDITVDPPQPRATILTDTTEGCEPLTIDFETDYKYVDSIIWDFDDGTILRDQYAPNYTFDSAGVYVVKLTVKGEGQKEDFDYKQIDVYQRPEVDFTPDYQVASLPKAQIQLHNQSRYADYYHWSFGDGETSRQKSPGHRYDQKGLYDITLRDSNEYECVASITKENAVEITAPLELKFPNAFRPLKNGPSDGSYDTTDINSDRSGIHIFHPVHKNVEDYHLEIFDRWGEKIFETHDIMKGWDGYYNGELCKQDVYIYKVEVKYVTGKSEELVGSVTLLR